MRRVTLFMMPIINVQYYGPRISPAEFLLTRPKRNQKAAGNPVSRSLLYPRPSVAGVVKSFLVRLRSPCRDSNIVFAPYQVFAFDGDRHFSSMKRGGAFRRRASDGEVRSLGLKA